MSTTTFVEATSADPFVRQLHRQAVRVLNDPSLDRQQREFHVRRLQSILLEHQAKQAAKEARQLRGKAGKGRQVSSHRNQAVADQSQVLARRKEFCMSEPMSVHPQLQEALPVKASHQAVATNDSQTSGRKRPVLSLKRA